MVLPRSFPVFEELCGVGYVMIRSVARVLDLPSDSMLIRYDSTLGSRVCTLVR